MRSACCSLCVVGGGQPNYGLAPITVRFGQEPAVFLDIVAPWIIDAWAEFVQALVFDIPRLDVTPDQAHAAMAFVAVVLLVLAWRAIRHMPPASRMPARGLMAGVLLVPACMYAEMHVDDIQAEASRLRTVAFGPSHDHLGVASATRPISPPTTEPAVPSVAPEQRTPVVAVPEVAVATNPADVALTTRSEPHAVTAREPVQRAAPHQEPPQQVQVAVAQRAEPEAASSVTTTVNTINPAQPKLVPQIIETDLIPVFYATNRARDDTGPRLDYTAERGTKAEYGRALVQLPRGALGRARRGVVSGTLAKAAKPPSTAAVGETDHLRIQEIKSLSHDDVLEAAVLRMSGAQRFKDHALVFVHGFNTGFDAALFRAAQIANDLNFDGATYLYSWPSAGRVVRYGYDAESARQAQPHLAEFLRFVVRETGASSVSIIVHGLGTGPVLDALAPGKGETQGLAVRDVILVAPDLDAATFKTRAKEIAGTSSHVTLYAAASDRALNISRRYTGGAPRAGDVPGGIPLLVPGVVSIDITATGTQAVGLNHARYMPGGDLLADIGGRLGGASVAAAGGTAPQPTPGPEAVTTADGTFYRYAPSTR